MISSRKLEDLLPIVEQKARQFVANCAAIGITVLIYCTYRDNEAQDDLYASGRTKPGLRVTNAKGGDSFHNYRCAFDFVPTVHGKPQWNDAVAYKKCADIAIALGFEWAGNWKGFKETAHLQYTGGLSLADLKAGHVPS
ncbi:D/-alanyl-D/-alanine carboxypeptidase [Caudoviricetes sp.]|nr:D/-alanyl-D/-alanine carboxypeptidase [Caudoviricetes sp.]